MLQHYQFRPPKRKFIHELFANLPLKYLLAEFDEKNNVMSKYRLTNTGTPRKQ
jgi:hypothetical protein